MSIEVIKVIEEEYVEEDRIIDLEVEEKGLHFYQEEAIEREISLMESLQSVKELVLG